VPTPTPAIIAAIRAILKAHNPIEDGSDGLYAQCEQLSGAEADRILAQLQTAPEVKVAPHIETAQVLEATRRALIKAGYALEV
jgi:thiamine monophosphate kinase